MWIAVALILGDTAITLSTMLLRSFNAYAMPNLLSLTTYLKGYHQPDNEEGTQPLIRSSSRSEALPLVGSLHYRDDKLTTKVYLIWILAGLLLCFASMVVLFGSSVPILALLLAVFTILPLSHVNIRCYGETGTGGAAYIGMWFFFPSSCGDNGSNPSGMS